MSNQAAAESENEQAPTCLPKGLRLQDIVARMARCKMRDTVRVLRAMDYILTHMQGSSEIREYLLQSALLDSLPAALHSKPSEQAIRACNEYWELLHAEDPDIEETYRHIFDLDDDPYMFENMKRMLGTRTAVSVVQNLKPSSINDDERTATTE